MECTVQDFVVSSTMVMTFEEQVLYGYGGNNGGTNPLPVKSSKSGEK